MKKAITIGHDSEGALSRHGKAISALEVFGEHVVETEHGRYFADNMNFEIAISPVTTLSDFHIYTEGLLKKVREHDGGYDLLFDPVVLYDDMYLEHPLARVSGCNADMSAYHMENNHAPDFTDLDGTRSLGAHIHAQLDEGNPYWFARWMDLLVTLPLLQYETPTQRREMYGKAGCLRVKDYPGAEYRTLSPVWVDSPERREFVWEMTHKAIVLCKTTDPALIDDWWDIPLAIDNHDLVLAQKCIDRLYIYGVITL